MSKSAEHAARTLQDILSAISSEDLIGELMTRDGISVYPILGGESYLIQKTGENGTANIEHYHGPTTIITVVDP
jgi:hypothetical protein